MIIIAVVVRSNAYVICYMSSFATFKLFSEVGRDHHGEKGGKTRRASLLSDDAFFYDSSFYEKYRLTNMVIAFKTDGETTVKSENVNPLHGNCK